MNQVSVEQPKKSCSEHITRWLGRCLSRWGVDALQYHWLLQASLKMDFRSSNPLLGKGDGQVKASLRTTAIFNVIFSGLLSLFFASASDTSLFAVILLGYAMAMLAMMILMEFGLAVISPEDYPILAHRPISSKTFLAVRFSNLMFYVLVLDFSLSIVPAFAGLLCKHSPWFFPAAYLLVSIGAALFVAGAVIAFYGLLMKKFNYEKFKDVLVYCQVLLSFLFFFSYQLAPRLAGDLQNVDLGRLAHGWGLLVPSVWFAGMLELALGHWNQESLLTGIAALVILCVLMPGLFRAISLDYSEQIARMITASNKSKSAASARERKGGILGRFARACFRDTEERAFFSFIVTMLRRNRQIKLQLYPNFGVMIAMFVLVLLDHKKMADPFSGQGAAPGFGVSFTAMIFVLGAVGLANLLPYSDEHAGGWIFQVAPVTRPKAILKAIRKATLLFVFLPLCTLYVILFSFFWPPLHALELSLYGLLFGGILFQLVLFRFRGFPFSRKPEKGAQSRQFSIVIMVISMFGVLVVLPLLLSRSQIFVVTALGVLVAANLLVGFACNRSFANKPLVWK